jgi:hypothetical protein
MDEKVFFAFSIGAMLIAQSADPAGGMIDVPPAAMGAMMNGSIGSTSSISAIQHVADTTIDREYPAWYASAPALSAKSSTSTAPTNPGEGGLGIVWRLNPPST